jgi:hypothetical protein
MKSNQIEVSNGLPMELVEISNGVPSEKINEVKDILNLVFEGVNKIKEGIAAIEISDENDYENMKIAGTYRLAVKKMRLEAEKRFDLKRSEVQALMLEYKTEDQLWLRAKQVMQILTKEIEEIARFKEETGARITAEKKIAKDNERMTRVQKYSMELPLSEYENMSDEYFEVFIEGLEKKWRERIEAEKKRAEELARTQEENRKQEELLRAENERLRAIAEEKERQNKEILDRMEAEQRKANIAALKAKQEAEKNAERERMEKELALAQLREKQEAEQRQEAERQAAIEAELSRGDRDKMLDLLQQLQQISALPKFKSKKYIAIHKAVLELVEKTVAYAKQKL